MKKTHVAALAALAVPLLLIGVRISANVRAAKKPAERPSDAVLVEAARVVRGDVDEHVPLTGSIRPRNEVDVLPKLPGRVASISAKVGDRVSAGQTLAVIEHKEISWQAKAASAALGVAKANLEGAKLERDRTAELFQGGAAPKAAMDGAEVKLSLARAQVSQAEAAAGLAEQQERNAFVTSPISGTVTRRPVDLGAQAGGQTVMFTVQDVAALKLESSVDAATFARIAKGTLAEVAVDARPGERFQGKVTLLSPALDPSTRRAAVEIEIDNARGRLLPNMFAKADLDLGRAKGVLVAPRAAIFEAPGGALVFRVKGGRSEAVRPRLGPADASSIAVLDGLAEGDLVAVSGLALLSDGAAVRVADAPVRAAVNP